eukprot:2993171-Lingulodinium_polyedra.AAC.1
MESVANPWPIHGQAMAMPCLRTVHELSMDKPWTIHGPSMANPRPIHGIGHALSMDNPWAVH